MTEATYRIAAANNEANWIDYEQGAAEILKNSGIRSNLDLVYVALFGEQVVGALYAGHYGNEFTFDIAIHPLHQRRGVGTMLIDTGMQLFREFKEAEPSAELYLNVVNPVLVAHFSRRGFAISFKIPRVNMWRMLYMGE